MFERLKQFFHAKQAPATPLPELDAAHALGALLVEVAIVDSAYLFEEIEQIDRILAAAYGLKPLAAAKMRAECERLAFATPSIETMAERIRDGVDYEHRLLAVEALWRVVLADGLSDEREDELLELIEGHLGVSPEDADAAADRAAEALEREED
ncbi:hypothetical protein GCM10011415_05980 [Salipiger pallidus]|uniref:Co-chaperone DjlA N-terminal domain-containing protein n=1 Tax=Salipiger pallidus TaxID=1775170 RepID=A0A8J3EFA1_9RHOB|nr:TerB family tellurite resistance protein [Salipiger pallidus]GGG62484.1 hypothetical protein GCM10011415_05980 [Salipiger pallidus]